MAHEYPRDDDGDALRRIAADGADMSRPMVIDFHVAAVDEQTARRIAAGAVELGYRAELYFDDEVDEECDAEEGPLPPWTCECSKRMLPEYDALIAAQAELERLARPLGACVDGWGTFGEAEEA